MSVVATEAIVLHAFDYLESSRILRLLTRDEGVQSVVARGARRSRGRFASALDLFAQGGACYSARPGREMHTLTSFDVTRARPSLAADLARFTGAAAIAELAMRFGRDEPHPEVFDAVERALDDLSAAPPDSAAERALAGAWALVRALGFAPALDSCASCHSDVPPGKPAAFSSRVGGVLCGRCAPLVTGVRSLPAEARGALAAWESGCAADTRDARSIKAHQRLLREFVAEHLAEGRALRAFDAWERDSGYDSTVGAR